MEAKIFEQGCARIADNSAYFTDAGQEAPKHQAWFENQIDSALDETENKSLPFDLPAILWQFTPTEYTKGNGFTKEASGTLILHVVQNRYVNGEAGSEGLADHTKLLEYADLVTDLFDGYKLGCSARPYMTNVERDHLNRPVMVDKITFEWSGKRKKPEGVPA